MSATTQGRTNGTILEISFEEVQQVLKDADERETLQLICDIAVNGGVLNEELVGRLERHPLYQELSESDQSAVMKAANSGAKKPLKLLVLDMVDAILAQQQRKSLSERAGWRAVESCTNQLLGNAGPPAAKKSAARRSGKRDRKAKATHS